MIRVFSTNRGVREFYASFSTQNLLIPKAITISEFESKAIVVKNRVFIDNDTRFLLLKEATKFSEFNKLQFSSEFLTFLNHSQYIFKFFEELASEQVSINDLRNYDTYALYDEHLDALEILRQRYIKLLDKNGFVDRINLPELYEPNEDYLQNLKAIEMKVDGFLSKYELELFEKSSKVIPFFILLELNRYNQKTKQTFEKYGFKLLENYKYKLDFTNKKIISSLPSQVEEIKVDTKVFNTRLSQIGFIFSQIAKFTKEKIAPENIVVILPDESLAPILKEFDKYKNLNFAMGFSLRNSSFYKIIEAIELYQNRKKDEQKIRIARLKISQEFLESINQYWKRKINSTKSLKILNELLDICEKEREQEIFKEELYKYSKFLSNLDMLSLEQTFKLFLLRLKQASEDDIGGGKVTVMGVLETRGGDYEGVIVPDFSDEFIPRRSQKDLFLNSNIRKNVGLPTKNDRENLQRFYYHQLFSNAKKVAISSVANETTMPSRFLDELLLKYNLNEKTDVYNQILFDNQNSFIPHVEEIKEVSYRVDSSALSATKLDTLLTCKRKFYFKYIKKLEEPKNILADSNATVGLKIHKILEDVLKKGEQFNSTNRLMDALKKSITTDIANEIEGFNWDIWIEILRNFAQNEVKRYLNGYKIFDTEIWLEENFSEIKICGKLDRIDIKDDKLYVIDYKSGDTDKILKQKIETMTNFQLEFYYLLASKIGEVKEVSYYNLREGKLLEEPMVREKIEKLKDILKSLKEPITTFELCEKQSNCIFCPYKKLCLREN